MKTVLIHGQNHKGSSYHIGRLLAESVSSAEEITEFFLPRDFDHFCVGCYTCLEDETKCPFWADKKPILDAMEQADLLIFTTPTYCYAPSAAMKSLLDVLFDCWIVHRPKAWMFRKKAVILSTSAGSGAKKAIRVIRDSVSYWGVSQIETLPVAVQATNWKQVPEKIKKKIYKRIEILARKVQKPVKVSVRTKFMFWLFSKMHAGGMDASPAEKPYWQERGWLACKRPWK